MSYARFSDDSSVYVFLCVSGFYECCGCSLSRNHGAYRTRTTQDMVRHLHEHVEAGGRVPASTFERLEAAREDNDTWIADPHASVAFPRFELSKEDHDGQR